MTRTFDLPSIVWTEPTTGDWRRDGERFVAVPRADAIRQLLPWRWSTMVATGARRSDDRPLRRQVRDTAGTAYLLSVGAVRGARRVGVDAARSVVGDVADRLGRDDVLGLVICGPPRANQKPVIQVHDRLGRTVAYVKVAWNDLTGRLLDDERAALERLAGRADGFTVPGVLATGGDDERRWLALAPVGVRRRRRPTAAGIDDLARSIERTGDAWRGAGADATFVRELVGASASLPTGGPTIATLADATAATTLDLAGSHGDFVPWNVLSGEPCPAVWDWERYRTAVPVGYDRLHHRLQVAVHRTGRPLADAARDLGRSLDDVIGDVPAEQRDAHLDWYLADLLCRYERDVLDQPAPLLPELVAQLNDVLTERLGRT
jgi:hypothetical protein